MTEESTDPTNPRSRSRWATVGDLWWALRALLLPILGIAVIGVFSLPAGGTVIALLVIVAYTVYAWRRLNVPTNGSDIMAGVRSAPVVGVVTVVLAVLTALLAATPGPQFVRAYQLAAVLLVWLGFLCWFGVFALRLLAFASTPQRVLFAVVLGIAYVRFFLGLFVEGPFELSPIDALVWPVVLAVLLGWVADAERGVGRFRGPGDRQRKAHRLGLSSAILSVVAFVLAGILSQVEPHVTSDSPVEVSEVRDSPGLQSPLRGSLLDRPHDLAREFAPVLQFTGEQKWAPIGVRPYLRRADLHELDYEDGREKLGRPLEPRPLQAADLDRECVHGERACHVLTIRCPIEAIEPEGCDHGRDLRPGYRTSGTAYTRVVYDRDDPPEDAAALDPDERRRVFASVEPYGAKPEVLVQYWLFYYYDDWKAQTLFGRLRQTHEADWEVVTVGFDRDRPLFVALSAHCGAGWVPWKSARVARFSDEPAERFHPVVGVAEGSQANYHALQENVPPNWARCKEFLGDESVDLASVGYRIRDRTGSDTALRPIDLRFVGDDHPIMRFPGYWGWNSVAHFETQFGERYDLEELGATAATPRLQPLWYRTIWEIFCGKASERADGGPQPDRSSCKQPPK
jgi:hypothetical protein